MFDLIIIVIGFFLIGLFLGIDIGLKDKLK